MSSMRSSSKAVKPTKPVVTLRTVIRIQDWLLWREFHSSPDYSSLFGCELKTTTQWFTLQSLLPQPGTLHLERFLKQKQKKSVPFALQCLWAIPTHKTKNTPKKHCNIARFQSPLCTNTVIQTGLTASPRASCLGLQDGAFISVSLFQAADGTQQDLLLHKRFTAMVLSSPNAACYLRIEQAAPSLRNVFVKSVRRKAAALHTSL